MKIREQGMVVSKFPICSEELKALRYHSEHPKGKIGTIATKPINSEAELSLAYSPGAAVPVMEIARDSNKVYDYTAKGNSVAVITNGTAILGLGNLGPLAAKPVMEGKAALFNKFSGIYAIDLEIDATCPDDFIKIVKSLEPTFGGINLEDIKSPDCFEIEKKLQSIMNIPVFHDDQHGTAIVLVAALKNACVRTHRCLKSSKIVINGAGAAGLSSARLLTLLGVPKTNLIMCDIEGVLHSGRKSGINEWHEPYIRDTAIRTIDDALIGADIAIGLSAKGAFTPTMISRMADRPIVFALANPDPEILPHEVYNVKKNALVATGRSDYPNQVNNLLAFPYIFRGALDVRATKITDGMKLAAITALVRLARENGKNELLPSIFDPRLVVDVAGAISLAAINDGVANKI